MYQGNFSDYRNEINALMVRVKKNAPELSSDQIIETVNKVLDWIEDKPGEEFSLAELAVALGDEAAAVELFMRMGPLMGGKPMTAPFFKVHAPDGKMYLLDDVYKVSEGENYRVPGTLEHLASSRGELEHITSIHFRVADFTLELKPGI